MKQWVANLFLGILVIVAIGVFVFQAAGGLKMQKTLDASNADRTALEQNVMALEDEITHTRGESDLQKQKYEELLESSLAMEESAAQITAGMDELKTAEESLAEEIAAYEQAWEEAKERVQ